MAWLARNPDVVCTELEDGAVLLNMDTRLYYSLNEVGLELWNLVEVADGFQDVAKMLTSTFEVDEAAAEEAASRFVQELEREQLVVAAAAGGGPATPARPVAGAPEKGAAKRPFAQPELIQHDEPLHEVSTSPFDPQLPLAE
jgi:hypothetical protein